MHIKIRNTKIYIVILWINLYIKYLWKYKKINLSIKIRIKNILSSYLIIGHNPYICRVLHTSICSVTWPHNPFTSAIVAEKLARGSKYTTMFLTFPQKTNRQLRYRCCRGNTSECLEVTRTTGANLSVSSSFSGSNGVPSSLARHNVTNLFLPERITKRDLYEDEKKKRPS